MSVLSALLLTLTLIALVASWVLMLIVASEEDFAWARSCVLLPPLAYAYALTRLDVAKESISLAVAGCFFVVVANYSIRRNSVEAIFWSR